MMKEEECLFISITPEARIMQRSTVRTLSMTCIPRSAGPKSLTPGQKCVVAIRAKNKEVSFRYFLFSHAGVSQYDGRPCRVFYGNFTKQSGPYSQKDAALIEPIFFNKNGHFNQWAALER
jgi:hypothetical protein